MKKIYLKFHLMGPFLMTKQPLAPLVLTKSEFNKEIWKSLSQRSFWWSNFKFCAKVLEKKIVFIFHHSEPIFWWHEKPYRTCYQPDQNLKRGSERPCPGDHFCKVWLNSDQWFQRRIFFHISLLGAHFLMTRQPVEPVLSTQSHFNEGIWKSMCWGSFL